MSPTHLRNAHWAWALLLAAGCGGGCGPDPATVIRQLHQDKDRVQADLQKCTQELADRDALITSLRRQVENRALLESVRLEDLFLPERLELASRTGGYDADGQPGDDGVVVYCRPVDADGDALKSAGQVTVQLVDVATPGDPREIGTYIFNDRPTLRQSWYGGLLTNHYTFKCAFPPGGGPRTPEVLVRVSFLDWLTGRTLVASQTVQINRIDPDNALVPRRTGG